MLATNQTQTKNIRRALVLSGGANRGAYEIGVLKHLILDLGYRYDAIFGVSAGALNAAFIADYNISEQDKAIKDIEKLWNNISSKEIYKPWYKSYILSVLAAMFGIKESLLDTKPLKDLIKKHIHNQRKTDVKLMVGVTCLHNGKFCLFDKQVKDFEKYVLASASIPILFPTQIIDGVQYVDGGIRENTPLKNAILEGNYDEIDVIIMIPPEDRFRFDRHHLKNIYQIAYRTLNILIHKIFYSEVNNVNTEYMIESIHKDCETLKINLYSPEKNLFSGKSIPTLLNFNPKLVKKLIDMGYNDAKNTTKQK